MKTFKEYLKSSKGKTKAINTRKSGQILTPVRINKGAKTGGFPYGTKKGQGGLSTGFNGESGSAGDGGVGESLVYEMQFEMDPKNNDEVKNTQVQDIRPEDHDSSFGMLDGENEPDEQDPNMQGLLRKVPGAHLVFKRQSKEGSYEELWIFHIGDKLQNELTVKAAILAGTDIDPQIGHSEDEVQHFEVWAAGNAQVMHITGLPN